MLNHLVLGVAAVMAVVASEWPVQAQANPIIESSILGLVLAPEVHISFVHTDGSPASELVGSFTITQTPFSSVTSSGGGSAFAGAPAIQGSDTSARISGQPFSLTVSGAGSATAAFGTRIAATFTNTGQTDENYTLNHGYSVNTFVQANPAIGETLAYSWTIGTTLPRGFLFESQSHVCNAANPNTSACQNFYDLNFFQDPYSLAAGQSATFDMTMDFNLAVTAAPEPPVLGLFAPAVLALGVLYRRRAGRGSRLDLLTMTSVVRSFYVSAI